MSGNCEFCKANFDQLIAHLKNIHDWSFDEIKIYERYQHKQIKLEQIETDLFESIAAHVVRMCDNLKQKFKYLHSDIAMKLLSMPPTDEDIVEGRRDVDELIKEQFQP